MKESGSETREGRKPIKGCVLKPVPTVYNWSLSMLWSYRKLCRTNMYLSHPT
jgi:hypothetical protein